MNAAVSRVFESKFFIPGCFFLFLLIRILLIVFLPIEMHSDALWYFNRAKSIADGNGYSEGGYPTAFWPVGYPGFLGIIFFLFGKNLLVGQIANLLLSAASFFLLLKLTRHIFLSETTARIAVLLFTLYPNNAAYTPILLTEVYFTFFLLLGCYIYITRRGWAWVLTAGLIFGVAALTKPQVLFLPGILILLGLVDKQERKYLSKHIAKGFVIYLAVAAVLVPWAVRNTLVMGETVLISTNGGVTLLTGNNPSADGGYVADDPLVAQRRFTVRDQVAADQRAKQLALQWIMEHPGRFIALMPLKIWHLWYKDGEAEWAYQAGYAHYARYQIFFRIVRVINQVYYTLLIVGMLLSIIFIKDYFREITLPWALFGYIFVVYLTIISMVFSGQPRFHFPVMPWIIMYSAWLINRKFFHIAFKRHADPRLTNHRAP